MDLLTAGRTALTELFVAEHADLVVNAAGAVWGVSEHDMVQLNAVLVEHLVAAVAAAPGRPRLVQLGSVYEYGPLRPGMFIDESTPTCPVTEYGRTKLTGTAAVLSATASGALDGVVLRIANVAGPGAPPGSLLGRAAAQLAAAARERRPADLILAPLRSDRDFVDFRDVADAVVAASVAPVTGRVINIGRGAAIGVRELIDLLVAASGIQARVMERPANDDEDQMRRAGVQWQQVDVAAAYRLLGWRPRHDLKDSLAELWREAAGSVPAAPS